MKKNTEKSFTLVEVLIFVAILEIFFVAAATVTFISVRNMKYNEHKIMATYYAEQLLNWMRNEKEIDWNEFSNKASDSYCFNSTDIRWPDFSGACRDNDYSLNSFYKRSAVLSKEGNPPSKFTVAITVAWQELGNNYFIPLNTIFTIWE